MTRIYTLLILLISFETATKAQYWSSAGSGMGDFYNYGEVYAMTIHNGDLYVGGSFLMAGGVIANHVAKWDGTNWSPLGNGMNGNVLALISYNGQLYATGEFSMADSITVYNIAKWDGNNWTAVGTGIGDQFSGYGSALAVYNGELYVSGHFEEAGGMPVKSIAKWNGNSWSPVGSGLTLSNFPGYVADLTVYNGELYAGGEFTNAGTVSLSNIARWNGNSWSNVSMGINGNVYSMTTHNNELYVGGEFQMADTIPAPNIAKWNGSNWSGVGNGLNSSVFCVRSHEGKLYAGGMFNSNSGNYISQWNGTSWSNVAMGMDDIVMSLQSYNNDLYAGGYFLHAGPTSVFRIAKLSDTCLSAPPQPGPILSDGTCGNMASYYIMPVTDAISYTWTLPPSWSGSSTGLGIWATPGNLGGILSVTAINGCGSSLPSTLQVAGAIPIGPISGNDTVCQNSVQTYSVPFNTNAYEYWWSFPPGWTYGPNGSSTITATAGIQGGFISVTTYDLCGPLGSVQIPVVVNSIPNSPGSIMGNDTVCRGSTHTYSINTVQNATGYTWSLPPGWMGTQNGNSIQIIAGNNSGRISVTPFNTCGTGFTSYLDITVSHPLTSIGNIQGDTAICEFTTNQYFITPVTGASRYNWQLPGGWAGQSDSNRIVTISNNFGGAIGVTAYNACGNISSPVIQVQVSHIIGDLSVLSGANAACTGSTQNFEVVNNPSVHSYIWTLPQGWTGNSNSASIQAIPGTTGGIVSVNGVNSCGASRPVEWIVRVDSIIPSQPGAIVGFEFAETEQQLVYSINPVLHANYYSWNILSGGNMGPGLNSIAVPVFWHTPGEHRISVQAINSCGTSAERSMIVKVALKGGIDQNNPYELKAAPNPSNGVFNLLARRAQDKNIFIEVLNIAGQKVYASGKFRIGSNNFIYPVNLEKMMAGVYLLKVVIEERAYTIPIVKTN